MKFPIPGVLVGHWTDSVAKTGCTAILFPPGTVASGEVRGGAPATREFSLLSPERLVENIHAVLLTGGSAFGLAAADGVVNYLEEKNVGFPTPAGPVPIVVAMGLYDLLEGDSTVRPGFNEGRIAASEACEEMPLGQVGAGTGASLGKWQSRESKRPGGIGLGVAEKDGVKVAAIAAVNALGDLYGMNISSLAHLVTDGLVSQKFMNLRSHSDRYTILVGSPLYFLGFTVTHYKNVREVL